MAGSELFKEKEYLILSWGVVLAITPRSQAVSMIVKPGTSAGGRGYSMSALGYLDKLKVTVLVEDSVLYESPLWESTRCFIPSRSLQRRCEEERVS